MLHLFVDKDGNPRASGSVQAAEMDIFRDAQQIETLLTWVRDLDSPNENQMLVPKL